LKLLQLIGSFFKAFADLFRRRQSQPLPPAPPPVVREPLEDVRFLRADMYAAPDRDLVVDFGTAATVVALVRQPNALRGKQLVSPTLLVGLKEHSSDMAIRGAQVEAVGAEAYSYAKKNSLKYYTSLKRYAELQSRRGVDDQILDEIVSEFLFKSIGSEYQGNPLGGNSKIVVSVPNSFNPTAVGYVRGGIVKAVNRLNASDTGNPPDAREVTNDNILIVRESEAVAYLYLRRDDIGEAPGEDGDFGRFDWQPLPSSLIPADGPPDSGELLIVLDVGGGTTDLSVVETGGPLGDNIRVILNAGVPLGGTDVDKLILRSVLVPNLSRDVIRQWDQEVRAGLLKAIRFKKDADSDLFFTSPEPEDADSQLRIGEDPLKTVLEDVLKILPDRHTGIPLTDIASELKHFREAAAERLNLLIALSVDGLFELIPASVRRRVRKVLLTGRGSKLRQIRAAVARQAGLLDAEVLTLTDSYHLKLAVAYGCALLRHKDFSRSRLPSATLGRELQVRFGLGDDFARFQSDFPISGEDPTVWIAQCDRPQDQPATYNCWEHRTGIPDALHESQDLNSLMSLGCVRDIARWALPPRGADRLGSETLYLYWSPHTDIYYPSETRGGAAQWGAPIRSGFALDEINLVTGLPLGFPNEQN
jgi:hypothetical protein